MSRFKGKPVGGLPGRLPEGETLLWQGAPEWRGLARYAFRVRIAGAYFAALVAVRVGASLLAGDPFTLALGTGVTGTVLGVAAVSMFCAFSWLISRSTTYSITTKRVVITYGMALPKSVNLPFSRLEAADVKVCADGTGDVRLRLPQEVRLSYLLLWPHVNAGKNGRAEPVLRALAAPQHVAGILAAAIGGTVPVTERATAEALDPVGALQAHAA
jgi:hypothetical protein